MLTKDDIKTIIKLIKHDSVYSESDSILAIFSKINNEPYTDVIYPIGTGPEPVKKVIEI